MKVTMLKSTYWGGKKLKAGDTVDVMEDVAARWERAGLAEKQVNKSAKNASKE